MCGDRGGKENVDLHRGSSHRVGVKELCPELQSQGACQRLGFRPCDLQNPLLLLEATLGSHRKWTPPQTSTVTTCCCLPSSTAALQGRENDVVP